jgi:geranylgeranyl pyrophosphate synthase
MTTCLAWTTTTCGAGSRRFTSGGTRRRRCLAGDALQTLAFELLCDPALGSAEVRMELVAGLAKASGIEGMVLGQALDIAAETSAALTLDQITALQAGKTGALIGFAAEAGAVIAGADRAPLRRYATALGLAFQIADDILDVTGDEAKTGKRVGKDAGRARPPSSRFWGWREQKPGLRRWWTRPRPRFPAMARARPT